MNSELKNLDTWFRSNKLSLNATKTNYILFRPKNKKISSDYDLYINNVKLSHVTNTNFLGVQIDEFLNWDLHCNKLIKKLSSSLYMLNSTKNLIPTHVLNILYSSIFESHLRYGILFWSNTTLKNLNKIYKMQKKAIRIITKSAYNAHTGASFKKLNILNIYQLIKKEHAMVIYRKTRNLLPLNISNLFTINTSVHQHYTRQHNNPHFQHRRLQITQKSFLHQAPLFWQSIPENIKTKPSIGAFSKCLKRYLLSTN